MKAAICWNLSSIWKKKKKKVQNTEKSVLTAISTYWEGDRNKAFRNFKSFLTNKGAIAVIFMKLVKFRTFEYKSEVKLNKHLNYT